MTAVQKAVLWLALALAALGTGLGVHALLEDPSDDTPKQRSAQAVQAVENCPSDLTSEAEKVYEKKVTDQDRRSSKLPPGDFEALCGQPPEAPDITVGGDVQHDGEARAPPLSAPLLGYRNGFLPKSVLAPIQSGYLIKSAAAAWNAMNVKARKSCGLTLLPAGSLSSYRNYAGQVYLYKTSRPGWAAYPGTSNHGWGLAVDLMTRSMRSCIDRIGRPYGWAKAWSDASWEWWHIKYRSGIFRGKDPGPTGGGSTFRYPTLKKGYVHPRKYTRKAQRRLANCGYKSVKRSTHYGRYDRYTRVRVKRFQARKHLRADGVTGPATWRRLLKCR